MLTSVVVLGATVECNDQLAEIYITEQVNYLAAAIKRLQSDIDDHIPVSQSSVLMRSCLPVFPAWAA